MVDMKTRTSSFAMIWLADLIGMAGRARQVRATWLGGVVVLQVMGLAICLSILSSAPERVLMVVTALVTATFFVRAYARNRTLAALAEADPVHRDGQARQASRLVLFVLMGIGAPYLAGLVILLFGHPGTELMHVAMLLIGFGLAGAVGIAIGAAAGVAQHDRPRASATLLTDGICDTVLLPHDNFSSVVPATDSPPPRLSP